MVAKCGKCGKKLKKALAFSNKNVYT